MRHRKRLIIAMLLCWGCGAGSIEPSQTPTELEGSWIVTTWTDADGSQPASDSPTTYEFAGNLLSVKGHSREFLYRVDVDTSADPKTIDTYMIVDDYTEPTPETWIYHIDGDTLLVAKPELGGEAPGDFEPSEGETVMTLRPSSLSE